MYGKIFDSIYKGTLYGQWEAIVTFQQMIVLCDADGVVDMTPPAIAAITSIPIDIIQKGIEVLSAEDPYSRTPGRDGRRIELIDEHRPWGWVIVNHDKYKNLQDSDTVRAQTRERVRKHREKKRPVTDCNDSVTDGNGSKRHTDTDTDTDTNKEESKPSVPQAGPTGDVAKLFDHWRAVMKHPGAKLTDERRRKITNVLRHYPLASLMKAVEGCAVTPHNMGENDRGERYDDICLIIRDSGHIERFMHNADNPPALARGQPQKLSPMQRAIKACDDAFGPQQNEVIHGNTERSGKVRNGPDDGPSTRLLTLTGGFADDDPGHG